MIKINHLKFRYATSTDLVLDIPQFILQKGEKVFLYGPSGCGKTTFLEIIAGINTPSDGLIQINGQNIGTMSSLERDKFRADNLGYIFQSFNLIPYLNVQDNITLPLYLSEKKRFQIAHKDEDKRTKEICQFLGIESLLKKSVVELSVGQQQRVAAARAILGRPELILADEPTSSLDFDHRERFIKLLFSLCHENKTSVLFVSHDRSLEQLFDRSVSLLDINKTSRPSSAEVL